MAGFGSEQWREKQERIMALWIEGKTVSEIAAAVHLTKNAVGGRVMRDPRYIPRENPVVVSMRNAKPEGGRTLRQEVPLHALPVLSDLLGLPPAPPVLVGLGAPIPPPRDCQWPVSADRPWRFCGAPPAYGLSYCRDHCRAAYVQKPFIAEAVAAE